MLCENLESVKLSIKLTVVLKQNNSVYIYVIIHNNKFYFTQSYQNYSGVNVVD
jgi:hypothetical protein